MVSTGDTEISLHIRSPSFKGGGGILESNTQSAKICLNFNFREGGTLESNTQSAQDLPKFQFWGEGGLSGLKFQKGALKNLDKNLLFEVSVQKPACASQRVSHILRMWRLN